MSSPREIVERYFELFKARRIGECRQFLSDDFRFQGPLDTFDNPDDFIATASQLGPAMQEARLLKIFADGNDVCVLWDFVWNGTGQVVGIAEWFQVEGEKIKSLRIMFDARPFAAAMGR